MKRILLLTCIILGAFHLAAQEADVLGDGLYARFVIPKGELVFELDYKKLPLTVSNFVAHAEERMGTSFYRNLSFYRIIPGYALFSGDPQGTGLGGADYSFPRERGSAFSNASPGALTMESRKGEDHGSRFMILIAGDAFLDQKYTSFGRIVRGEELLRKVKPGDPFSLEILRIGADAQGFRPTGDDVNTRIAEAREQSRTLFIEENPELATILDNLGEGVEQSETGIFYKIHKPGDGGNPRPGNTVRMHYSGRLITGQEFDNSFARGEPFSFTLGEDGVIPGWVETALSMEPGEQRTILLLPAGWMTRPPCLLPGPDPPRRCRRTVARPMRVRLFSGRGGP